MNYLRICASLGLLVSYVAGQGKSSSTGSRWALTLIRFPGCSTDDYQPVTSALNSFPPLWSPATILPNDTAARSRWDSISNNIPTNIPLKGTANGDYENDAQSYDSADPDCWWTVSQCISPKLSGLPPDIADVLEPNTLGYSFDDGPSCSHDRLYGYLDNQHQKATMFFIGSNVISWPLQTQRAFSDGHEICLHTWSHSYMTALSSEVAFAELYYSTYYGMTIKLVAGVTPTCWRPPYGDVDDRIRAIANQLGLRTILWNYDSNDWTDNVDDVDQNYEKIIEDAEQGKFNKRGAILLMHELDNFTMSKAIEFYPRLKSVFKYIVPVGVSINESHPYVEGKTSLPSFQQCE
ncbi:carbohydrate esterase family 4 protein [Cyathus striatus]|nr:carbohydrate esterase family 4 protein [Cyathus striatus]